MSLIDASRIVIDAYRVMLQIVAPLTYYSRDVIYDRKMFIAQAIGVLYQSLSFCLISLLFIKLKGIQ
jgi:hypothetical protein